MTHGKSKKAIERTDLDRFLKIWPNCPQNYNIERPKSDFPDFILSSSQNSITIELTMAVTSEYWMAQSKYLQKFKKFVSIKSRNYGLNIHDEYFIDPQTKWFDLWTERGKVWNWILKCCRTSNSNFYEEMKFGGCLARFCKNQASSWFNFGWTGREYINYTPEKKVAFYIVNSIVKKIRKYLHRKKANILVVISLYAEPVIKNNYNVLEKELHSLLSEPYIDNQSIRIIASQVFEEIYVLICERLIRVL